MALRPAAALFSALLLAALLMAMPRPVLGQTPVATRVWTPGATGVAGDSVRLDAWLMKQDETAYLPDQTLTFSVGGTQVGSATTDANGRACVFYAIPAGSQSPLTFAVSFAGSTTPAYAASSATGSLTLVAMPPTRVYLDNAASAVGENVSLRAWHLRSDNYLYLAGKTLSFTVGGLSAGSAITDATGSATVCWTVPEGLPSPSTISVSFAGEAGYSACVGTANLTLVPLQLGGVSVNPTSLVGGAASSTGTVTLNRAAPCGGTLVSLASSSPSAASVPASVSVPEGHTSATFSVTTSAVATPGVVTIWGASATWTQAARICVLPTGQSLAITDLEATGGNSCVVLTWADLPDGATAGHHVYRQASGGPIRLTQSPQATPLWADTGLANGTEYQYQVSVVNSAGQEVGLSAWVAATPTASVPTLTWSGAPSTATGEVVLSASLSSGGLPAGTMLLVDGRLTGGAGAGDPNTGSSGLVQATVDTSRLSDGTHTVQMVGYVGSSYCATTPLLLETANAINGFASDEAVLADEGELAVIDAALPPATTSWRLAITRDADGATVREWQGSTPALHLAWDATDASGAPAADGLYTAEVTAYLSGGAQQKKRRPVALLRGSPNGLALIQKISGNRADDQALATTIQAQFARMATTNPAFRYWVLPTTGPIGKQLAVRIRAAMTSTVTDFYLFGHGTPRTGALPPGASYGCVNFWSSDAFGPGCRIPADAPKLPALHVIVPWVTNGRQYNLAMIDACNSAGGAGGPTGAPGAVDTTWAAAFNIGTNMNFSSCFLGWDGGCGLNTFDDGMTSNWLRWRQAFWTSLADGYTVFQATYRATTTNAPPWGTVNPWDVLGGNYRCQLVGDTWVP